MNELKNDDGIDRKKYPKMMEKIDMTLIITIQRVVLPHGDESYEWEIDGVPNNEILNAAFADQIMRLAKSQRQAVYNESIRNRNKNPFVKRDLKLLDQVQHWCLDVRRQLIHHLYKNFLGETDK